MRKATRAWLSLGQLGLGGAFFLWSSAAAAELVPLRTAAALSSRPRVCAPRSPQDVSIWRSARASSTQRALLCARMAEIGRLLSSDPVAASQLVEKSSSSVRAGNSWVGPAGLEVDFRLLQARSALANGQSRLALELFHRSAAQLPITEWDPATLRDFAVSALAEAKYQEVVGIYRRLVAVSAWLDTPTRIGVRLEAAVAVLRLPQPDGVEALGYLSGLDAQDSDSSVAVLVTVVQTLTQNVGSLAATVEQSGVDGSAVGLRRLARLSEHDWQLIESWITWSTARDAAVWDWTRAPDVPDSYRRFAEKLTSGG